MIISYAFSTKDIVPIIFPSESFCMTSINITVQALYILETHAQWTIKHTDTYICSCSYTHDKCSKYHIVAASHIDFNLHNRMQ